MVMPLFYKGELLAFAANSDRRSGENLHGGRFGSAIKPFSSGSYVNTLVDEGDAGVRRAYGAKKRDRLGAWKAQYDPNNVFHLNQKHPSRRIGSNQ